MAENSHGTKEINYNDHSSLLKLRFQENPQSILSIAGYLPFYIVLPRISDLNTFIYVPARMKQSNFPQLEHVNQWLPGMVQSRAKFNSGSSIEDIGKLFLLIFLVQITENNTAMVPSGTYHVCVISKFLLMQLSWLLTYTSS